MRLLLLSLAAILPAGSAAAPAPQTDIVHPPFAAGEMPVIDPSPDAKGDCPPISRYHAMRRGGPLAPRNLTELPAADHYKAVYRRIDGCEAPIIVGFDVGGSR
jgi:hypothetical protein